MKLLGSSSTDPEYLADVNVDSLLPEEGNREKGTNKLESISLKHMQMIDMYVDGMMQKDIAVEFNMCPNSVCRIFNDPMIVEVITNLRKQYEEKFLNLYGKAVDVIEDGMSSGESIDIRLRAANTYFAEASKNGNQEKETAEDVVQKIINMQINGDVIVNKG